MPVNSYTRGPAGCSHIAMVPKEQQRSANKHALGRHACPAAYFYYCSISGSLLQEADGRVCSISDPLLQEADGRVCAGFVEYGRPA